MDRFVNDFVITFPIIQYGLWRIIERVVNFDAYEINGQRHLGLQAVPIDKIVCTEGHQLDFDRAFFTLQSRTRDRWVRVAQAYDEQVPLPPVELLKIGEIFVVRDGHHRISVAQTKGQNFIDANVTELDVSIPVEPPKKS